jgi:hypothetical protein
MLTFTRQYLNYDRTQPVQNKQEVKERTGRQGRIDRQKGTGP